MQANVKEQCDEWQQPTGRPWVLLIKIEWEVLSRRT